MSVRTTADDRLEDAREGIKNAILALSEIVVGNCWGHDDFDKEYRDKIEDVFIRLLEIRKAIE